MWHAYADFDLTVLNELLDLMGAKVIGGNMVDDHLIRLHLAMDGSPNSDFSCKYLDFSTFIKVVDITNSSE